MFSPVNGPLFVPLQTEPNFSLNVFASVQLHPTQESRHGLQSLARVDARWAREVRASDGAALRVCAQRSVLHSMHVLVCLT